MIINKMFSKIKNRPLKFFVFGILCLFFLAGVFRVESSAKDKKLVVDRGGAAVHLEPDPESDVIAELKAGAELMLASDRKFKKAWNYVYFSSGNSGAFRSGYIHDRDITRLYSNTTVQTVAEEGTQPPDSRLHFRKTSWGMTTSQVMASEGRGGKFTKSRGFTVLSYQENILSQGCELNYVFDGNQLTGAKYRFKASPENRERIKNSCQQIRNVIARQYGPPSRDDSKIPYQSVLSTEEHLTGASDELLHRAKWTTPDTDIMLFLYTANESIILDVEYIGRKYKELFPYKKAQSLTEKL